MIQCDDSIFSAVVHYSTVNLTVKVADMNKSRNLDYTEPVKSSLPAEATKEYFLVQFFVHIFCESQVSLGVNEL